MEITEVRIKLMDDPSERLRAFCSVTFDNSFVVRDLKIIEGTSGPFVAMPSRKLTSHCNRCGAKNHLRALYCNQCGSRVQRESSGRSEDGRAKLYADIAHPINSPCREMIQSRVVEAYQEELVKAQQPGYVSRYDDYDDDIDVESMGPPAPHSATSPSAAAAPPAEPMPVNGASNGAASKHAASSVTGEPSKTASDDFGAGIFG